MYKYRLSKIITIIINLISILIIFVPFSTVFYAAEETTNGEWVYSYGFENLESIIVLLPFYLCWVLFQKIKHKKVRIVLGILCLLLACFYSFYAIMACIMPIQDFMPSIGVLLLFSIFPFLLLLFIVNRIEHKIHNGKNDLEDILDVEI